MQAAALSKGFRTVDFGSEHLHRTVDCTDIILGCIPGYFLQIFP